MPRPYSNRFILGLNKADDSILGIQLAKLCLKANLPMIIMEGNSFPSRVGSSIYASIGLSELVAKNYLDYENIAINLANDKSKLLKIKTKINIQVEKNYLFNSKKFTLDLEDIYYKLSLKI